MRTPRQNELFSSDTQNELFPEDNEPQYWEKMPLETLRGLLKSTDKQTRQLADAEFIRRAEIEHRDGLGQEWFKK
jgi:hypothetical protein